MKIAMSALAVLAVIGGLIQIPGIDDAVTKFLEPTFADSKYVHVEVEHRSGVARPGDRRADRDRRHHDRLPDLGRSVSARRRGCESGSRGVYVFLSNKWYFDEIIDFAIVRPTPWLGRVVTTALERDVISRRDHRRHDNVVRAGSAAVRARANRLPALLRGADARVRGRRRPVLPDLEHVSTTFSILIWLPLAISLVARVRCRRAAGGRARGALASLVTLGIAISFVARFKLRHSAFSSSPTRCGSPRSGSTTSSGWTG